MSRCLELLVLILCLQAGCAAPWPAELEQVLAGAGENRPELERYLSHYRDLGDPGKLEAAEFLVANMADHGYVIFGLYNEDKEEIPFDALDYKNFKEAQAALDALEKEHGTLDFKRKIFTKDVDRITARFLMENTDLAFEAWLQKPWAKDLAFEAFLEHVLPYRSSNEPLDPWRRACMERYKVLPDKMEDAADIKEAGKLIQKDVHGWVRFSTLYYLHPTDQGFGEMNASGLGRCEDISNMMSYALRANAVPSATDYTPYWADRDNNHAWEVILDAAGRGKAGLSNRAAKVYRKTFSIQQERLACRIDGSEEVPRWLSGKCFKDVTAQYLETSNTAVLLTEPAPEGTRFAYICVFNGGEWKAIHWGEILDGRVTFTDMGRNIAYLPAYYADEKILPAAPPIILTREGGVRTLHCAAEGGPVLDIEIAATTPETPDADTKISRPRIPVKPGRTYELFFWRKGWQSLGKMAAGEEPVLFKDVPAGGLYWLVEEGSRRLERIFTIEEGKQVWW